MAELLPRITDVVARVDATSAAGNDPPAAHEAAIATAELIAAEAAAEIANEAAATAAAMVVAASTAASQAVDRARNIADAAAEVAIEVADEVAATAVITAQTMVVAAASAATAAQRARSEAVAADAVDVDAGLRALARDVAEAMVAAASVAAEKAALRAREAAAAAAAIAAEAAAQIAAEAAATAAAMLAVASVAAAKAADRAAHVLADAIAASTLSTQQLQSPQADEPAQAAGLEQPLHDEWAVLLADPVMARFAADGGPSEAAVNPDSPAEQGLWRDISLAQRAHAALIRSEAQYQKAFHGSPTAMVIATVEPGQPARFVAVNRAMARLVGHPDITLLDLGFADLASPTHGATSERAEPSRPVDGEPYELVLGWRHADGHDMLVSVRVAAMEAAPGAVEQVVCHIEDLTQSLCADASLRAAHARYGETFWAAPEATVIIELTPHRGVLFAADRSACLMFGRDTTEVTGLPFRSLAHPLEGPVLTQIFDRMALGELSHYDGEHRYRTLEGDVGWFVISAHVVNNADDQPAYVVALLRDYSEHQVRQEPPYSP